jgi:hypothetical protein
MSFFPSNASPGLGRSRPSFKPRLEQLEDRCVPARLLTPVIFVPGQPASLPSDFVAAVNAPAPDPDDILEKLNYFLTHLGAQPEDLTSIFELNPFAGFSDDKIVSPTNALVDALEDKGYVLGVNLFIAAHDWRMPIAPPELVDADDGILRIGTTLDGSDDVFDTGLDYMAYWMDQASEAWLARTGKALKTVDVISHSEGYLLARAYVSSTLYRGTYIDDDNISSKLPSIRNWVSLGAPNGGASGIYNLLQNNFNNDLGNADDGSGLYPIVELAYLALTALDQDIIAPDGSTLFESTDPDPDPLDFIQQYMPSLRAEMPTYGFLDIGSDVNDDAFFRNDLLLDVNFDGPGGNFFGDPNGFVKRLKKMSVFYGAALPTESLVVTVTDGAPLEVLPLSTDPLAFGETQTTTTGPDRFQDITTPQNGDSVLPLQSSEELFKAYHHRKLKLYPQERQEITHNALVTDDQIHEQILNILGVKKGRHWHQGH